MSIKAKFPGKCPLCFNRFIVGQDDIENRQGKWVHVVCPSASAVNPSQDHSGRISSTYKNNVIDYSQKAARNVPMAIEDNPIEKSVNFSVLDDAINAPAYVEQHKEEKVFTPSVYQKAIFEAIEQMVKGVYVSNHLVIEAVAGSGKTTTIVQALKLIPEDLDVAFVAYNKHIAIELGKRAPSYVHVCTSHVLGKEVIEHNVGQITIDSKGKKVESILNNLFPVDKTLLSKNDELTEEEKKAGKITKEQRKQNYNKRASMRSLITMAKSTLVDVDNQEAIDQMIEYYALDVDDKYKEELTGKLRSVLDLCKADKTLIDFDDMLWLPVVLDMDFIQYDFLMGDEWQDMNACQLELLTRSIKPNGHLIAVGDRKQSLYGFRGADIYAIPRTIEKLNAAVLPLSVTYRCPSSHVERAKQIVPQIEARENAPEGTETHLKYRQLVDNLQDGDMVICRTNAPLIAPAFECIRRGKKAIIRGKDGIGNQMISLVKKFETDDIHTLEINLTEYYTEEVQKLVDHGKEMQAVYLTDKVETLRFIIAESKSVNDVINKISTLFDDNSSGIVFSSYHRAKGLEAERVFILGFTMEPHPRAKQEWEKEQEMNAIYVALTRSKADLFLVEKPKQMI